MKQGDHPSRSAPRRAAISAFDFKAALLAVGGLSMLFGLLMEGVLLLLDPASQTIAELVRQVVRATLICLGLTLGMASVHWRAPAMGLAGLLTAPCATYVVVFVHAATATMLDMTSSGASGPPMMLALAKGIEYGCLGVAVGWLEAHAHEGLVVHVLAGLVIGLVFGGVMLGLSASGTASGMNPSTWLVNEVLFPTGCATIIFMGNAVGKRRAGRAAYSSAPC